MVSAKGVSLGRWLAGKLMKELDIGSCQVPAHKYKRGGNEHVEIPNHLDRHFAVTAPDQVWCGDVTYIWTGKCWAYLYRAVDSRSCTIDFYLTSRRNTKAAYRFMGKLLNNTKRRLIPRLINTDKAPTYGRALGLLKREGKCPQHVQHRQIMYRNNIIECDHGKLKRIINATLGFKSMKTAYATIKGIKVMGALRKGQAESLCFGHYLGEIRLVSRVFER